MFLQLNDRLKGRTVTININHVVAVHPDHSGSVITFSTGIHVKTDTEYQALIARLQNVAAAFGGR